MSDIRIWLAAFVQAHSELSVKQAVAARGYEVVLPTQMVETNHARQKMLIEKPVFPRYLVIGVPHGVSWYPLRDVTGILGILSAGKEPRKVPDKVVKLLKAAVLADAFTKQPDPEFSEGQAVKVKVGSAELDAFVERVNATLPARRIDVVFSSLGKEHKMAVPVELVRAA